MDGKDDEQKSQHLNIFYILFENRKSGLFTDKLIVCAFDLDIRLRNYGKMYKQIIKMFWRAAMKLLFVKIIWSVTTNIALYI